MAAKTTTKKAPKKKAKKDKPVFADTKSQLHTISGAKAIKTEPPAPAAVPAPEPAPVEVPKAAPVKPKKKQTVEQLIASGEVDPDHFVKWGDLKDRLK